MDKCKKPIEQAIKDAKLKKEDIDKIILVGGPTRMPIVQKFVEDFVGKKVERGIDPMECVAQGAAIQGAVLAGDIKDLVLLDVTPLTLGIETLGGVMTPLIERNTTIPTKKSQIFSTAADFQTAVTIHVLQGERLIAKDNTSLGNFNLVGIPPAPKGVPQIEVTFDIDASGILHVIAKDLGTGKEQKMAITASTKLSDSEVEKMIKEAEEHAEEDKKRKEQVEARNNLDSLIYASEKTISELGDKIGKEQKEKIEKALESSKKVLEEGDIDKIKQETEALQMVMQEAGTKIYEEASKKAAEKQAKAKTEVEDESDKSDKKKGKNDAVDAEYEVEKDK